MTSEEIKFDSGTKLGPVSGILHRRRDAGLLCVFAHGAGAGMLMYGLLRLGQLSQDTASPTLISPESSTSP